MTGTVKLTSAGGGSVSLVTPSTGSNRTVTLPDADVTIGAQNSDAVLTTSGDLLYQDGSGLQRLPKGDDGKVLKLASGVPSWAADAGGNCELVGRTVISSGSSNTIDVEDTALFDGTYDRIMISITGARQADDDVDILGLLKYGGSYVTGLHYETQTRLYTSNNDSLQGQSYVNQNTNAFFRMLPECGNAAGESWAIHFSVYNPSSTTIWKNCEWHGRYAQKDALSGITYGGGYYRETGALQGVRFRANVGSSSGSASNITDAVINKYGWKTS